MGATCCSRIGCAGCQDPIEFCEPCRLLTSEEAAALAEAGADAAPYASPKTGGAAHREYARRRGGGPSGRHHECFPSAVCAPATAQAVAGTLKAAAAFGYKISCQSGGHSVSAQCGDIVLLLRHLKAVEPDAEAMTVRIGGGCVNGDVDAACAAAGIACTLGNASTVGAVGALLGGGVGYLARHCGLSIDNVVEFEVALADGTLVTAAVGSGEHRELAWALCGGGASFGVVTSVLVRCVPVRDLLAGERIVLSSVKGGCLGNGLGGGGVVRAWRDYAEERAPNAVSCDLILPLGGPLVQLFTHKGTLAEGRAEKAKEWDTLGRAAVDLIGKRNYHTKLQPAVARMNGPQEPLPHGYFTYIAQELPDAAVDKLLELHAAGPANGGVIHIERLGGAILAPPHDTAFGHRAGKYWIAVIGVYGANGVVSASLKRKSDVWMARVAAELTPLIIPDAVAGKPGAVGTRSGIAGGPNINVFAPETVARLEAVKARYDPEDLFPFSECGMVGAEAVRAAVGPGL